MKTVLLLGKEKIPNSSLTVKSCEVPGFPYIFPTGKLDCSVQRTYKLSPIKYFNRRLFYSTQLFASESAYIFYALCVTQQLKLNSQINVALKKVCGGI